MQPDNTEYTGLLDLLPKQKMAYRALLEAEQGSYLMLGYGGAVGGGKSMIIGRAICDMALGYPGISMLLCRQQLTTLKETTLKELWRQLNPALIHKKNENEGWCEIRDPSWPPGIVSRIKWLGVQDVEKSGSAQYQAIFFDEASEAEGEAGKYAAGYLVGRLRFGHFPKQVEAILRQQCGHVDHIRGRCESKCPKGTCYEHDNFAKCPNICPEDECPKHGKIKGNGVKYIFFVCSNPAPGFFTDWFWKKELGEIERSMPGKLAVHFVHALPRDNPFNGENYVDVLAATLSDSERMRLVEGRFDVFAGLVYEAFNPDVHAWHGPVPEYTAVYGGLDFGQEQADAHWTGGIVAIMTRTGRLIRVDEFKERGVGVYKRQQEWMVKMHEKWARPIGKRIRWVGDKNDRVGVSMLKDTFDIVPSKGGRDSEEAGIKVVATRLNKDASGIPGSFYLPDGHEQGGCPKWAAEMKEWTRDKETLKPSDEGEDLADCDRYMHEQVGKAWGDPGRFTKNVGRVA